ncbi:hypothetical protein PINS_up022483 [Pythium insidiosum]|nr:hypothetical protein PINS_up022483 [Pythium insidiosum]
MDAYETVRVIGKGSFGVVTQILRKSDKKALVWKEVNYGAMSEKEKQLIVSEVNILRELRHPHIVRYLDRVIDKQATKIYIVMEYCEGGDLSQYIKRKKREGQYIDENFIWHIFTHIFLALKECHRHREGNVIRPILHRDIKPGNIFLDANNNAKLGDFGLAKELSSESRFAQTNRSDIWALGCLLYEMATLAPPFDATNQLALAKKINAGKFARIPSQYSEGLFQVIRWMLHRQRSRRPRIEDLERVPQLQQRLRAYAAANNVAPEQQIRTAYDQKMKELLAIEDDLRRQEAGLIAREKKLKEMEADYMRRDAELKKREQILEMMTRKISYANKQASSPTTSDGSSSSFDNYPGSNQAGNTSPRRRRPMEYQAPPAPVSGVPSSNNGSPGRGRPISASEYQLKSPVPSAMSVPEDASPLQNQAQARPRSYLTSTSDPAAFAQAKGSSGVDKFSYSK